MRRKLALLVGVLLLGMVRDGVAQEFNMYDYWLMPYGRALTRWTVRRDPTNCAINLPPTLDVRSYAWWRGALWGRSVYLQSFPENTGYDVYVDSNNQLEYWASFRGNAYTIDAGLQDGDSHGFGAPFMWMRHRMFVGEVLQQAVTVKTLKAGGRYDTSTGTPTFRLRFVAYMPTFTDPDSGLPWTDVIKLEFWSEYNSADPNYKKETYWQGRNLGTLRYESTNCGDPNAAKKTYAAYFEDNVPMYDPELPWFDPTNYLSFVRNGYMERLQGNPPVGAPITGALVSWSGSTSGPYSDQVISQDAGDPGGQQPWKITLRGSSGGGDSAPDHAISKTTDTDLYIPVVPGRQYTLSGWLFRGNSADNVYLDFNDGRGRTGGVEFTDVAADAVSTNTWEYRQATTTVGPTTTGIRVRCVRDGANVGNAYCDGITLTRTPPPIYQFSDVGECDPIYPSVEAVAWYGIAGGCGTGAFCPGLNISREQMAVFLVVAKWGNFYVPPACTTAPFGDVSPLSGFCRWIKAAADQGIMAGGTSDGCTDGNWCPPGVVTRAQMAKFLLKAREGSAYAPPACVQGATMFGDVSAAHSYCSWIEEIARRGITGGCGGGNYCPDAANTRGQMAVFLTQDFGFRSPLPFCSLTTAN